MVIETPITNNFDWEFLKSIALVMIPTVSGIIASKLIVNSWQIRNEKSRIKRQILNEYENSCKLMRGLIINFVRKISYEFIEPDLSEDKNNFSEYHSNFKKTFRQNFDNDFSQLENGISDIEFTAGKLHSSLRLYYKNEKLVDEHREILSYMFDMFFMIKRMFYLNNIDEWIDVNNQFHVMDAELLNKLKKYETKLVDLELDKNVI